MPDEKTSTPKPRPKGDVSYVVDFDMEDMDFIDFMWTEDHDPPPIAKPKKEQYLQDNYRKEEKGEK